MRAMPSGRQLSPETRCSLLGSPVRRFAGLISTRGGGAPSDLTSAVMRRALLEHTEGVTVRLVRLIEALAVPRPHGKAARALRPCPGGRSQSID
jgi:hypothetical protein